MKYFICALSAFLLISTSASAQDYQAFRSDRIYYFNTFFMAVRALRFDSVNTENATDSVLYPRPYFEEKDQNCVDPLGTSWMGAKIIIRENGETVFFNKERDSIFIRTNTLTGDSWTFYTFDNGDYFLARVEKIQEEALLDTIDSVKYISLQLYNILAEPVSSYFNTDTLKLSKEFGLLRSMNFYFFPAISTKVHSAFEEATTIDLVGICKPELGIQDFTWLETFDFQPGDEIHIEDSYLDYCYESYHISQNLVRYLDRTDYEDSIVYLIEEEVFVYDAESKNSPIDHSSKTLTKTITKNAEFDHLPGETIITDNQAYRYFLSDEESPAKMILSGCDYLTDFGNCWYQDYSEYCSSRSYYMKGLGGPYYDMYFPICAESYIRDSRLLKYYKKGNTTWGIPVHVEAAEKESNPLVLLPNPATSEVRLELTEDQLPAEVSVYSSDGRLMLQKRIENSTTEIPVAHLPAGLYLLQAIDAHSRLLTTKFRKD